MKYEHFKESPNLDHLRITVNKGIKDRETRELFIQLLRGAVKEDNDDNNLGYVFACFVGYFQKGGRDTEIHDLTVYVRLRDFIPDGQESIDPVIYHELSEIFELVSGDKWPIDYVDVEGKLGSEECHKRALVEEFIYAINKGIGEKHLNFILASQEIHLDPNDRRDFVRENRQAYKQAEKEIKVRQSRRTSQ